MSARPCRFCVAAFNFDAEDCGMVHRHDAADIEPLARTLAIRFQTVHPSDEQVGWFLGDADNIIDDFDPRPDRWKVRRLPYSHGFTLRFRLNDVTYVIPDGEGYIPPVRLSTFRSWEREAEQAARRSR